MYYSNFPAAPTALVSGISVACGIPTISEARVGRDNSLFLTIFQDENWRLNAGILNEVAAFCEVEPGEIDILPDEDDEDVLALCICSTGFDFSAEWAAQDRDVAEMQARLDSLQEKIGKLIRASTSGEPQEEE